MVKVVNPDLHKGAPYAPLLPLEDKPAGSPVRTAPLPSLDLTPAQARSAQSARCGDPFGELDDEPGQDDADPQATRAPADPPADPADPEGQAAAPLNAWLRARRARARLPQDAS